MLSDALRVSNKPGRAAKTALVAVLTVVFALAVCPLAFAAFSPSSTKSLGSLADTSGVLGVTVDQSNKNISLAADTTKKFDLDTSASTPATALSQMASTIDRSSTLSTVKKQTTYEITWNQGKLTGDYAWHTSEVSFFETGGEYGVAVEMALLDQYPMGTVIELSYNGKTVQATVCDCGDWQSSYGHTGRMWDIMPGTCEQLGWDATTRWHQGATAMTWRVVSYG